MSLRKKTIQLVNKILHNKNKRKMYSEEELNYMERQVVLMEIERQMEVKIVCRLRVLNSFHKSNINFNKVGIIWLIRGAALVLILVSRLSSNWTTWYSMAIPIRKTKEITSVWTSFASKTIFCKLRANRWPKAPQLLQLSLPTAASHPKDQLNYQI